ncbi:MAG: OmpA family protein [Clostridiales bacterium]|nr:OmpA family protein [Clostridiales bacterium]
MRKRYIRNTSNKQQQDNFWPSFADVMSTVALVLLFLVMIVFIKNIIISINLEDEKNALNSTQLELENKIVILTKTEEDLENLDKLSILLNEQLAALDEQLTNAEKEKNAMDQIILILADTQTQLESIIAINSTELEDLRMKLQSISVLQASIFETVQKSIESTLGEYNDQGEKMVVIGSNANLYITASLVFDTGSSEIKSEGKALLTQLAVAFEVILNDSEVRDYIDSISVEGHTDSQGSVSFNRELSSERATNVLNYIMYANPDLETKYGSYFAATGFSELRPISSNNTTSGMADNRRIEFSIKVKDDNVQKIIEEYLNSTPGIGGK